MRTNHNCFTILIIALSFFCNISNVNASHISGGDICKGINQFEITLKLYIDFSGITVSTITPVMLSNSCGLTNPATFNFTVRNSSNNLVCPTVSTRATEVSQLCPSQLSNGRIILIN